MVSSARERNIPWLKTYAKKLRVKAASLEVLIAGLSGGNQQKIALAKWLARECGILIVDEPTRGVDVGAKAEIHHLLDELACQGLALLVISIRAARSDECEPADPGDAPGRYRG